MTLWTACRYSSPQVREGETHPGEEVVLLSGSERPQGSGRAASSRGSAARLPASWEFSEEGAATSEKAPELIPPWPRGRVFPEDLNFHPTARKQLPQLGDSRSPPRSRFWRKSPPAPLPSLPCPHTMLVFSEFGEVTPLPALIPCHSREEEEHRQLQTGFRPETAELSKVTKGQLRGREHCFPEQGPPKHRSSAILSQIPIQVPGGTWELVSILTVWKLVYRFMDCLK